MDRHQVDPRAPVPVGRAAPPAAPPGCDNKHETCKAWANAGECANNPGFMLEDCRWACKACPGMANERAYLDLRASGGGATTVASS